jgi:hypothetical protein
MESKVTEIARDVYRISTFNPDFGIQLISLPISNCQLPIGAYRSVLVATTNG